MKKIRILILLIFCLNAFSAFELKPGAKAAGMGYAFSAYTNGAMSVFYNPANIAFTQNPDLNIEYEMPYYGTSFDSLGLKTIFYSHPETPFGNFGAGIMRFDGNFYSETTYIASYAKAFIENNKGVLLGVSFKYLRKNIDTAYSNDISSDPFFDTHGTAVSNITFDAGISYHNNGFTNSIVVKNLTQPNLAYQDSIEDKLPLIASYGFSKKMDLGFPLVFNGEFEYTSISIGKKENQFWYAAGIEAQIYKDKLFLRAGYNKNEFSGGLSYTDIGFDYFKFGLDYSVSIPYSFTDKVLPQNLLSHKIGINFSFGDFWKQPDIADPRWQKKLPRNFSLHIEDGVKQYNDKLILWVKDKAGNISLSKTPIIYDTTLPIVKNIKNFKDENQLYTISIVVKNGDYIRFKNYDNYGEWEILKKHIALPYYDNNRVNYYVYEVKNRAGNISENNFCIYQNKIILNPKDFPIIKSITLLNNKTKKESSRFQSTLITVKIDENSADISKIYYKIDNDNFKALKFSQEIPINLDSLKSEGIHSIAFYLLSKSGIKSNLYKKSFIIDNTAPKCYYTLNSLKKNDGYHDSSVNQKLNIYQSPDTRYWQITSDTLENKNNWSKKYQNYDFKQETNIKQPLYLQVMDEALNKSKWYKNYFIYEAGFPAIKKLQIKYEQQNDIYLLNSYTFSPKLQIENCDTIKFIFENNTYQKLAVSGDSSISPLITIPQKLTTGKIIIEAYNKKYNKVKKEINYNINIDLPVIAEIKLFDLHTNSSFVTNNSVVGLLVFGENINKINYANSFYDMKNDYTNYNPFLRYRLDEKDSIKSQIKYIFAKAIDYKNIESQTAKALIKLDIEKPTAKIKITTNNDDIVKISKVEVLYKNISNDTGKYFITEYKGYTPLLNSPKWQDKPIKFYTFNSKNDGLKTIYIYLADKAGNISTPIEKTVKLVKFKDKIISNKFMDKSPTAKFTLMDISNHNTYTSSSDSIAISISSGKEIARYLLSEKSLNIDNLKQNKNWTEKEIKHYIFKNTSSVKYKKDLYLYLEDTYGNLSTKEIKASIIVDKIKTYPTNILPKNNTSIMLNNNKILISFNKRISPKLTKESVFAYCYGSKSGFHAISKEVKDKVLEITLDGNFIENEQVSSWVFGNYFDINRENGYLFKQLNYKVNNKSSKKNIMISGGDGIDGYSNSLLIEANLNNTNLKNIKSYKLYPENKFKTGNDKIFAGHFIYQLNDFDNKKITFLFQYTDFENNKSKIFKLPLVLDNTNPAIKCSIYGDKSINSGYTNSLKINIDINADEDIYEYLIENK